STIGVTSGASVPEELVDEVLRDLAEAGYRDVAEVKTAEEDLMFSLPRELRKELAGDARAVGGRGKGAE
ncbi:MAG TPA: 4-hydroxy-3-methylbut-2-enyl diphosphate reductase, partial [Microbacteriaceae bacterium]|nr:4-hydroxy-3-methylbut-2-enyl diphosphate reductase [Microbacteriaceae bacterium]